MSKLIIRLKNIFRTIMNEDIRTILAFSLVILSVYHLYVLSIGYLVQIGLSYNTPSIGLYYRSQMVDTDNDLLPDLVETTAKGEDVIWNGQVVGKGTGTNPNLRDSDHDLFTDGAEDNLGTDPNNFFNPGYLYFIWLIAFAYFVVEKFRRGDKLRAYREFDEIQVSGGVIQSGSKYAFRSRSIFTEKTKKLTDTEKQDLIEKDLRYLQMMGLSGKQSRGLVESKLKRLKIKKRSFQILIALTITWIIRFVISN